MLKYLHLYLPSGRFVTTGLKAAVVAGFTALLVWQLQQRLGGVPLTEALSDAVVGVNGFYFFAALVLVIANWGIEAYKWQRMAHALQPVGFVEAMRATLYAASVGFITPNRVGESIGKASMFDEGKRASGVALSVMTSCTQLLVTLIAGSVALLFTNGLVGEQRFHQIAAATGLAFASALCIYLFRMRGVLRLPLALQRFTWIKKIATAPRVSMQCLLTTVVLSSLRYVVFTVQFLLLLAAFGCALPFVQGALVVSVVFYYLTWLPVPTAAEPGFRGNVALFFLTPLVPYPVGIVCAATLLWIINLLVPAVAGAAWFLTDKRV